MATDRVRRELSQLSIQYQPAGDRVWIQDFRSLHCLNAFVGDPIYLSEKVQRVASVSGVPPVDKEGMVFWYAMRPPPQKRLAVVSSHESGEPFYAEKFEDILLPALFNIGSMFLVIRQGGQIFLKTIQPCLRSR